LASVVLNAKKKLHLDQCIRCVKISFSPIRNPNSSRKSFEIVIYTKASVPYQEVMGWADSPSTGENTYYERKRRKNETDQHDEDQQQTEKGLTIGHLKCTIT
jgi:hypothetical protein